MTTTLRHCRGYYPTHGQWVVREQVLFLQMTIGCYRSHFTRVGVQPIAPDWRLEDQEFTQWGRGKDMPEIIDWREKLVHAVAYRMHARTGIDPLAARIHVRDFVRYGHNSRFSKEVLDAAMELFSPIVASCLPAIQAIFSGTYQVIEREIANGQSAEGRLRENGPL